MAAVLFNLWNPYLAHDGTLVFEATQADTFRIGRGSRAFLDAALHALGIAVGDYTWQITAGRSLYYSDDPECANWRDRWVRTWRIQVPPIVPLEPRTNTLFRAPIDLGASDDTAGDAGDGDCEHTAFVIVDFQKPRDQVEGLVRELHARSVIRTSSAEIRELADGFLQVQLASELKLPASLAALEDVVAAFRAAGGAVNWRWRLTWPALPREPSPPGLAEWLRDFERLRQK